MSFPNLLLLYDIFVSLSIILTVKCGTTTFLLISKVNSSSDKKLEFTLEINISINVWQVRVSLIVFNPFL